jgi:iron(II)-dependent oxidoreductase
MQNANFSRKPRIIMLLIILLISLSACAPSDDELINPAKQWLQALLKADGLELGRYTCAAFIDEVSMGSMAMGALSGLLGSALGINTNIAVDLEDATFRVSERSDSRAVVVMGGEVIVAVGGTFQRSPVEATFLMGYEDERWRVCGYIDGASISNPGSAQTGGSSTSQTGRVTRNADWTPVERDFDGVTMVQVPAGCFQMGSGDGDSDEKPIHEQCFDQPFWIDKYEVTQEQFNRLGGRQENSPWFSGSNRPVESITWFEAGAFCELRGVRLPTEAEWEYAARGPESRIYPWGNQWNENNLVWDGNSNRQTADVGSKPAGVSWVGAYDLSGNVWEWTSSLYEPYPYDAADGREADTGTRTDVRRVLRGGSWDYYDSLDFRAPYRGWDDPNIRLNYFGFRCARSS